MEKPRITPDEPAEGTQIPVKGVDLPDNDTAMHGKTEDDGQGQLPFAENEGLGKRQPDAAIDPDGIRSPGLEDVAHAAQRGRTA